MSHGSECRLSSQSVDLIEPGSMATYSIFLETLQWIDSASACTTEQVNGWVAGTWERDKGEKKQRMFACTVCFKCWIDVFRPCLDHHPDPDKDPAAFKPIHQVGPDWHRFIADCT